MQFKLHTLLIATASVAIALSFTAGSWQLQTLATVGVAAIWLGLWISLSALEGRPRDRRATLLLLIGGMTLLIVGLLALTAGVGLAAL